MSTILLVILILIIVGGLPNWPHTQEWGLGYFPSGIGLVLLIILIVILMNGHI
jgi:hypothetical protein